MNKMTKQSEIEYLRGFILGAETRIQQFIQHELKAINNFGVQAGIEIQLFDETKLCDRIPKQYARVLLQAIIK